MGLGCPPRLTRPGGVRRPVSEPTPEPGWLAVTDVARVLDANERTARRWVTRHSTYIRTRRDGRLYLVAADAMSVLRRIRDLYAEGRTAAQVDMALAAEGAVATLDASKAPDTPEEDVRELQRLVVTLADAVAAVREEAGPWRRSALIARRRSSRRPWRVCGQRSQRCERSKRGGALGGRGGGGRMRAYVGASKTPGRTQFRGFSGWTALDNSRRAGRDRQPVTQRGDSVSEERWTPVGGPEGGWTPVSWSEEKCV